MDHLSLLKVTSGYLPVHHDSHHPDHGAVHRHHCQVVQSRGSGWSCFPDPDPTLMEPESDLIKV